MSVLDNLVEVVKFRIGLGDDDDVTTVRLALQLALSAFNMVPAVTYFSFEEDEENIAQISDLLVTYAAYILLTRKAARSISDISDPDFQDLVTLSREAWNNWDSQVNNLKQSDSFYEDFVQE
jgi:hypothetical protein